MFLNVHDISWFIKELGSLQSNYLVYKTKSDRGADEHENSVYTPYLITSGVAADP